MNIISYRNGGAHVFIYFNYFYNPFSLFLWMLLISSKKSITNEEQYIEDNLQMQFLNKFATTGNF